MGSIAAGVLGGITKVGPGWIFLSSSFVFDQIVMSYPLVVAVVVGVVIMVVGMYCKVTIV